MMATSMSWSSIMVSLQTFFRNDGGNLNHWLQIKLVGTKSNRNAIGAQVTVTAGDLRLVDQVKGGGSYLSASDYRLHFGLGKRPQIDSLEIRWPSGIEERLKNIKANQDACSPGAPRKSRVPE